MIRPENAKDPLPADFDSPLFECSLVVDLNWLLGEFLGTLFAPEHFRKRRGLCRNGYVLKKDLVSLFERFHVDIDLLIKILDHYEVRPRLV